MTTLIIIALLRKSGKQHKKLDIIFIWDTGAVQMFGNPPFRGLNIPQMGLTSWASGEYNTTTVCCRIQLLSRFF